MTSGLRSKKAIKAKIAALRELLKAYRAQRGRCKACSEGPLEHFIAHHVKPKRLNGPDSADNYEIVCSQICHTEREVLSKRQYGTLPVPLKGAIAKWLWASMQRTMTAVPKVAHSTGLSINCLRGIMLGAPPRQTTIQALHKFFASIPPPDHQHDGDCSCSIERRQWTGPHPAPPNVTCR